MIPKSLRRIRNYLLNDLWRDAFDERGGLQCSCLGKLSQCLVEVFFNRLFEVESDIAEVYPIPEDVCHVFIRHKRTQRFVDKPHYLLLLKTKSQQAQERGLTPTKAKQNVSHLSTLLLLNWEVAHHLRVEQRFEALSKILFIRLFPELFQLLNNRLV